MQRYARSVKHVGATLMISGDACVYMYLLCCLHVR
jgi:hypothetical protein